MELVHGNRVRALDGGSMEWEVRMSVSRTCVRTERRQKTSVWGRGAGTVPFFESAPGAVLALDIDIDLVVG